MKPYARTMLAGACALALAMAAAPAGAAVTSTVTMGPLVMTLTDLDLNDGIAPSINFSTLYKPVLATQAVSYDAGDFSSHVSSKTIGSTSGSFGLASNDQYASATASLTAADSVAGATGMSVGGAASSAADGYGGYRSSANGSTSYFTLSANTRVSFSVMASMSTATTIGYNLDADQGEYAQALLLFSLSGYEANGDVTTNQWDNQMGSTFNVRDDGSIEGQSDSWSGLMTIAYSNTQANTTDGVFEWHAAVDGVSAVSNGPGRQVPAVPEPATYGMLLAGLALVGQVARRRRHLAGAATA